ncbi:MAG: AIPR family protein [Desulfovibrionaceae bacterium]|nr:AIPR family protein [Desulfovibrionaceae bacterium]
MARIRTHGSVRGAFSNGRPYRVIICDKFDYNAFQSKDPVVKLKNMQIINGGQTCKTIFETLKSSLDFFNKSAFVMVRIYQLPEDNEDFIRDITYATNS